MANVVAVIGAGASGLLTAGFLAQRGAKVIVLEKMHRTALKVRISGKGRCNITNALPIQEFISYYPGNGRFLHGALHRFTNQDCIEFFKNLGIATKVERGYRVFPVSNDAHEIANALESFARKAGAEIYCNHKVCQIKCNDDGRVSQVYSIHAGKEERFSVDKVVLATGGLSYPGTGSSGDGLTFAKDLGHKIVTPKPALVPIRVAESWIKELSGLSLRNVELTVLKPQGGQRSFFGELMFAHFGLTGPIVLTASELIGEQLSCTGSVSPVRAYLDLKPALDQEQLDRRLLRDFEANSRRQFRNSLDKLLPKSLIPIIIDLAKIPAEKACHQITKEERINFRSLLKRLPLTITGLLPISAAIVTAGGVDVSEVDPRTMESKKVPGLFFCGEVLDIHGVTGGFNLQAAFSTGYCAAQGIKMP